MEICPAYIQKLIQIVKKKKKTNSSINYPKKEKNGWHYSAVKNYQN